MDDETASVTSSMFTTASDLLENPHHKNYEFIQKCIGNKTINTII